MRSTLTILMLMALFTGCEMQDPSALSSDASPATAPERVDRSALDREATIAAMYAEYRAEAFPDVPDIEVAELAVLESETPIVFVDCREEYERAVSVIPGAISKDEFEEKFESYRDHLVVTYCTIGYRSGVYAQELNRRDVDAINLIGGVLNWAHAGNPFLDASGEATRRVHVYGPTWDLLPDGYTSVVEGGAAP